MQSKPKCAHTVLQAFVVLGLLGIAWVGLSTSVYGQLATSPWPMFLHDLQHTGRSPYRGPETPELKWEYETGGVVQCSPTIGSDGTVYVGSEDANLYAINPDGSLKWKYETGDWVFSSPAIGSDRTIYVGSRDNKIYAIGGVPTSVESSTWGQVKSLFK